MLVTRNTTIIFKIKPAFIIFFIDIFPLPNMTAFGGVATGNIKAQLAAIVDGMAINNGLIFMANEKAIKIGVKVAIVAVLEFNSVKKIISVTKISINKKIFKPSK